MQGLFLQIAGKRDSVAQLLSLGLFAHSFDLDCVHLEVVFSLRLLLECDLQSLLHFSFPLCEQKSVLA